MNVDENYLDADKVCQFYNKKYDINMQYLASENDKIEKSTTNTGYIIPTPCHAHYYGAALIDVDDKDKYCIITDTMTLDQHIAVEKAKQDNRKIIRIGEGLQRDMENCKVFAINMVKYLLQDDCRIAKSLIEFYSKNKQDNYKNIDYWLVDRCNDFNKKNIQTNEEYKTLGELLELYKQGEQGKSQAMQYVIKKDLVFFFRLIARSDRTIEDIEKGVTLLKDVPNEKFLEWEYAGEFLKLAQSLNLQSKAGDKKAGKKKVELKNYSKFYSSLGDKVDDIDVTDKEKLKDKTVSTKIYCKKEKYKNITNNGGNLDEETYRKSIKPMINFDAKGCEQLKGKFNKINK